MVIGARRLFFGSVSFPFPVSFLRGASDHGIKQTYLYLRLVAAYWPAMFDLGF
jgi:hypothetical protein